MNSGKDYKDNATVRVEFTVRWGDCDAAGITYYAKYFDWFTDGRIAFLEKAGLPYMATFHNHGIELVVIDAFCRYRLSLRPVEKVFLETSVASLTRTRITFTYRILKEDNTVAAEGSTNHAFVDERGKPFNLAKKYPELWDELYRTLGEGGGI
ncbi:MAG: acyl-CoA thioesterase YbgC [Pelotomaculum sp. PtaB.Bin013]|uniref:Acyl-CoA thioesterase n=1 Tax=Pelotomaculum isophthalicicum JI TaxID=947010 RepID=A0A9X4GY05_9FIRM|nr:acyl-CoA thioesterase [Pelotomaculum isophthalicicum]MDF9407340.1 acyl-CoA thioesterase [Pelotomaculum isophthalicicum JI]OPX91926.1 MAG: acyl-CoA thioesterase YbgC [Pelotomaculum sp. PtaB.Bin013]